MYIIGKFINCSNLVINLVGTFKIITSLGFKSLKKTDPLLSVIIKHFIFSLENFSNLSGKNNFDKYQIFDYRIKDQLILK